MRGIGGKIVVFLVLLHAGVLLAGFLAPYDYAEQHRDYPFAAPMTIHFAGLRPTVGGYPVHFFVHGRLFGVDPPGVMFLLGSDAYGRDVLSRLLYGARISLFTGLLAAFVSLGLGVVFGTVAGYYGGWPDGLLMRTGELVLALPWFYLLLAVRAFLPLHISTLESFVLLVVVIGGVGWVRPARLIRGAVLSGKERDFVTAARSFGASDFYLIRRHILPLTWGIILTQATVVIPQYILAEVGLSFLGLGVGEPVPSWGNMLSEGLQYHAMVSHPWLLLPGLATIPVLLSYLILADSVLEPS
jgi:peptide/nickel transport system permease protein